MSVSTIGHTARQWLESASSGEVAGITSRGVFAGLPGDRVVFLSGETFRGPLTLNLTGRLASLAELALRAPVHLSAGRVSFPPMRLEIDYASAAIWEAPQPASVAPPGAVPSTAGCLDRLRAVARAVTAGRKEGPLAAALAWLLGEASVFPHTAEGWRVDLDRLQPALSAGGTAAIVAALQSFLGRGSGLTPSGDDLVLGAMLAFSRWGGRLSPAADPTAIAAGLLPVARRQTTTLSACLIECAACGQADERLVLALDGIVTGNADVGRCAAGLSGWGSSSGVDALAGMAVVLMNLWEK